MTKPYKTGILVGGSGLIGGTLMHYFKTIDGFNILAPNSKKLSLRVPADIRFYFKRSKPDFIINCAIATITSDYERTLEINCLGTTYLARAAQELEIPYIHISSAAVMPSGKGLTEEARLQLTPDLQNYPKGKLLAELALEHIHRCKGLDFTNIRLAIVYGAHDHKIQGFHRLLFSIAGRSMPVMLTTPESAHSYSNAAKLPAFVAHILSNRKEFSGQTYNFVDPVPVPLAKLILEIKRLLVLKVPREIFIPYPTARFFVRLLQKLVRFSTRVGIEARLPAEVMFLQKFYDTQTLSAEKLLSSSFTDTDPDSDIFTALPGLLEYYIPRWEHLNLIERSGKDHFKPSQRAEEFLNSPDKLLNDMLNDLDSPFLRQ